MRLLASFAFILLFGAALVPAHAQKSRAKKTNAAPGLGQLQKMTARFAPTTLRVDTSKLSSGDRQALVKLIEAGRIMDDIFMVQYWSGDPALYSRLQKDKTPLGKARLHYFDLNKGPWSELDGQIGFLADAPSSTGNDRFGDSADCTQPSRIHIVRGCRGAGLPGVSATFSRASLDCAAKSAFAGRAAAATSTATTATAASRR